jgi:hypothetical protein
MLLGQSFSANMRPSRDLSITLRAARRRHRRRELPYYTPAPMHNHVIYVVPSLHVILRVNESSWRLVDRLHWFSSTSFTVERRADPREDVAWDATKAAWHITNKRWRPDFPVSVWLR